MKIGSLCSGFGGLELGVTAALGGEKAWFADPDPAAAKVLAHHWPGMPNHGDITNVDWTAVEPVDVVTAGPPCQPVSVAGRRKGETDERWLWRDVIAAVRVLRPQLVYLENPTGLLAGGFGRVLGFLAQSGFNAQWTCLRASDVGAPHRRERVFITAWPAAHPRGQSRVEWRFAAPGQTRSWGSLNSAAGRGGASVTYASGVGRHEGRPEPAWQFRGQDAALSGAAADADDDGRPRGTQRHSEPDRAEADHEPQRVDADGRSPADPDGVQPERGRTTGNLGCAGRTEQSEARQRQRTRNATGNRSAAPTDVEQSGRGRWARDPQRQPLKRVAAAGHSPGACEWGRYCRAVHRWEALTRPAPNPTESATRGGHRLSPRFVEWHMGLPEGWVTAVPGLTRNQQLTLLGNGVVPAQAEAALGLLLIDHYQEAA